MSVNKYSCGCLLVLLLLMQTGCGSSEFEFVELEGVVTVNGEVVPGVSIDFKPVGQEVKSSMAVTEEDGTFRALCTMSQAGVIRGENDVTFSFDPNADMWDEGDISASPALAKGLGQYCEENGPIRVEFKKTDKEYQFEIDLP